MLSGDFISVLTDLFNHILNTGHYPQQWSRGILTPIHKGGSRYDPINYRGITVLNSIGKIFTSVLQSRLLVWAEERSLIPESQFGFRSNRSTVDCIFILNTVIEVSLSQKKHLYVCYVDFKKAFDSVNHTLLWSCLVNFGVSHRTLTVLQSMYASAYSCVKISSNEATAPFKCQKGVRQGCILSPLLFTLFLAGLDREIKKNNAGIQLHNGITLDILMYADDVALVSDNAAGLKKHLSTLLEFCLKWKLEVNTEKTKICIFGRNNCSDIFKLNNHTLEKVQSYKYLGMWFAKNGRFQVAKKHFANQAKKAMFSLLTTLRQLDNPPIPVILQLYETMLKPIMCYGSEVWGFTGDKNLERVELYFLKSILHLPSVAPNMAVFGELGQLPIHLWWKERVLKYWNRICSDYAPSLLKAAFHLSLHNASCGRKCWVSNVATLLNNAGLDASFSGHHVFDRNMINSIMSSYRDQFVQVWHANLMNKQSLTGHGGNKLRSYRLFKKEFDIEPYLLNVRSTTLRVSMTRLRVGCHSLEIERGRYHKTQSIPVCQRLCEKCNMIEDEIHFMCVCSKYNTLRDQLEQTIQMDFPGYKWLSSEQKFIYLLESSNKVINNAVAYFIHNAFIARTCTD